jgi:hypothetical protein
MIQHPINPLYAIVYLKMKVKSIETFVDPFDKQKHNSLPKKLVNLSGNLVIESILKQHSSPGNIL